MKISIISLFPEMIRDVTGYSIIEKALKRGIFQLELVDIRDFTTDIHRTADDTPYGGGPGMVLKIEPVVLAIESVKQNMENEIILLTTPAGYRFEQRLAKEWSKLDHLIIIAGHYEGIDERIFDLFDIYPVSIGDYVLTGGELPALVILDAVVRLLPDVLGNPESLKTESFQDKLLDCPHYTRPPVFRGKEVPGVLLSGNHKLIEDWRRKERIKKTRSIRPDLLNED